MNPGKLECTYVICTVLCSYARITIANNDDNTNIYGGRIGSDEAEFHGTVTAAATAANRYYPIYLDRQLGLHMVVINIGI